MALIALNRLKLDAVWWLVSPGNPLKDNDGLQSSAARMEQAAALAAHPRMPVSNLETALNIRYTADLAEKLSSRASHARFVWIMGSDNLATFHLWERWRDIAVTFPIAVVNRPGTLTAPLNAPAAHNLAAYRMAQNAADCLAGSHPPAWTFLIGPRAPASSSAIRQMLTSQFKNTP